MRGTFSLEPHLHLSSAVVVMKARSIIGGKQLAILSHKLIIKDSALQPPSTGKSHIRSAVNDFSGSNADGCDILAEPHVLTHTPT